VFVGSSRLQRGFGAKPSEEAVEVDWELINDTQLLEDSATKGQLVPSEFRRRVGIWLLVCAGAVLGMIVLGGYTRLSKSGLSMTRWKPIQYQYPSSDDKWLEEFEHYKVRAAHQKFPEYLLAADKIDLQGFKRIFFVEWAHRAYGNAIGLLFGLPMIYFWARGCFRAPMKRRMLGLLALGGSQGLIGWWMVKSGLQPKPAYHNEPKVPSPHQVSVYRLFVHLNCAIGIFSLLFWNGLTLVRPSAEVSWRAINMAEMVKTRKGAMAAIHFLVLTIAAGSIVAGLDAGKVFNTWPLMNGQ
jgi:cytochrome c oxidase assembly protein subunit 15